MQAPTKANRQESNILVGVSACLLGEKRRYDGKHKKSALILQSLCSTLHCVSLCPEYGIGLGVPRQPITLHLIKPQGVRAIMPGNKDVTSRIQQYAKDIKMELACLSGYILKSKSPSCGVNSSKLQTQEQKELNTIDGVFTTVLRQFYPELPICEETDLDNEEKIKSFIVTVTQYHRNRN